MTRRHRGGARAVAARWARAGVAPLVGLLAALCLPALAQAHARVSPDVSQAGVLQLYSLAVPTEKSGVRTTGVTLTMPAGFSVDSFVASPGWHRTLAQSGSGGGGVVQRVTWTGGSVPSGEDALFQFLAQPAHPGAYRFVVRQSYSDGSIVNWNGTESAEDPAPSIEVISGTGGGSSSGGGSVNGVDIAALILAVLAVAGSALALVGRGSGGRPLT